ncbi:MAG: hypothetical protein DRP45_11230 [Candidatus Zixiibacteriota bacterium]|nr:MAG: hypothetical protein DRP45_11230 [candidate division Zixibacteria bacterium]
MNKTVLTVVLTVLLAMAFCSAYAGNSKRIGTAGALELQIPIAARGAAMGGAVMANTFGVEAMVWNPAGLAYLEGTEAMFTHLEYIADINVNYVGVANTIEDFGTIGGFAKIVSIGDMEETTQDYPNGTGRIFNPTLAIIGVSYARILTANVSFGATAKFINENIFEVRATGFAVDMGFLYDPQWRGFSMGIVVKNYGPEMSFSGTGFEDLDLGDRPVAAGGASFDLPSSINLGVAYDLVNSGQNVATWTGNFRSNNYYEDLWQSGFEYTFDGKYSLRGGYNFSDEDNWLYGVSLGAGVVVDIADISLTFEYSWTETDVFSNNQFFTVKGNF